MLAIIILVLYNTHSDQHRWHCTLWVVRVDTSVFTGSTPVTQRVWVISPYKPLSMGLHKLFYRVAGESYFTDNYHAEVVDAEGFTAPKHAIDTTLTSSERRVGGAEHQGTTGRSCRRAAKKSPA